MIEEALTEQIIKCAIEVHKKRAAVFLILIFIQSTLPQFCFSQTQSEATLEQKLEEISENSSNEADFSDLTDDLNGMLDHPINLNHTTAEELRKIPFLTEKQIGNLIGYHEKSGEFLSIYELQAIPGFDSLTIGKILPYIIVQSNNSKHPIRLYNLLAEGNTRLLMRYQQVLQRQQGYSVSDSVLQDKPNAGYLGSPQRYYFRLNYNYYDRLSIGLTGEKDPGEEFFKSTQPNGMDFYGGYLSLHDAGPLKTLVIGNFNAGFGQGLTLSTGISIGSLPSSGNLRRIAGGIRPGLSVNENSYMRGVAATIQFKKLELSFFYSNHKRDANLLMIDTNTSGTKFFSVLQGTGYHRTPAEMTDRHAVREMICGGNINFRHEYFSIGFTAHYSHLSANQKPSDELYKKYSLYGNSNLNAGIDYQFFYRSVFGFGEVSLSRNKGLAFLAGLHVNPDPAVRFSLIYRDYLPKYQNLFSDAIGRSTGNANEKGLILNLTARLFSRLGITSYVDIFRFPWLKYRTDFISSGSEFSCQVDYTPFNSLLFLIRYHKISNQINGSSERKIESWVNQEIQSLRFQTEWIVNSQVKVNSQFYITIFSTENRMPSDGYLISEEISYKPRKLPVSVILRYAFFDTDSYDARIYTYEHDVLYGYSVPAFDGKGIRFAILASVKPFRFAELSLRYAMTLYTDRNVIGTGLETINGNVKSEVKVQLQIGI